MTHHRANLFARLLRAEARLSSDKASKVHLRWLYWNYKHPQR